MSKRGPYFCIREKQRKQMVKLRTISDEWYKDIEISDPLPELNKLVAMQQSGEKLRETLPLLWVTNIKRDYTFLGSPETFSHVIVYPIADLASSGQVCVSVYLGMCGLFQPANKIHEEVTRYRALVDPIRRNPDDRWDFFDFKLAANIYRIRIQMKIEDRVYRIIPFIWLDLDGPDLLIGDTPFGYMLCLPSSYPASVLRDFCFLGSDAPSMMLNPLIPIREAEPAESESRVYTLDIPPVPQAATCNLVPLMTPSPLAPVRETEPPTTEPRSKIRDALPPTPQPVISDAGAQVGSESGSVRSESGESDAKGANKRSLPYARQKKKATYREMLQRLASCFDKRGVKEAECYYKPRPPHNEKVTFMMTRDGVIKYKGETFSTPWEFIRTPFIAQTMPKSGWGRVFTFKDGGLVTGAHRENVYD